VSGHKITWLDSSLILNPECATCVIDTFGHPSKHEWEKTTAYHGITRITVTKDEITGWTYNPRFGTETISINASIAKQTEGATRVLGQLRHELEAKRG
jgi:hypothetical protein